MTQTEIVLETIEYYMNHDRARAEAGGCLYRTHSGAMCGVGRCLTPEALEKAAPCLGDFEVLCEGLLLQHMDEIFQPQYHGHDMGFWNNIQVIHDNGYFWDGDPKHLTKDGLEFIRDNFSNETYEAVKEKFFKN